MKKYFSVADVAMMGMGAELEEEECFELSKSTFIVYRIMALPKVKGIF